MTGEAPSNKNAIDISWMPWARIGMISSCSLASGRSVVPNIKAIDGPYKSQSQRPTRAPVAAKATARLAATVDLPTPPLPEAMAMMRLTPGMEDLPRSALAAATGGAFTSMRILAWPISGSGSSMAWQS